MLFENNYILSFTSIDGRQQNLNKFFIDKYPIERESIGVKVYNMSLTANKQVTNVVF